MFDLHILKTFGILAVSLYLVDKVMNHLIKGLNYLINRKENMKKNNQKFAERLKELRKEKGLTQSQVGVHLGMSQQNYRRWEVGERSPSGETLIKLADYFDVSIDYLVGRKMKEHELKLDIKYFDDVKSGKKKFEIRKNNRDFQVGDTLRLIAVDSGKYVFKQGIGTIPIKKYKWKKCKKIEAETIRVKILSVMNAELYNSDEVVDDVLVMFGAYDLRDVKKVLSDYFKVNKLPDNYVVLGIEKLVKNK